MSTEFKRLLNQLILSVNLKEAVDVFNEILDPETEVDLKDLEPKMRSIIKSYEEYRKLMVDQKK